MRSTPGIDLTLRVGRMAHRYGLPAYEPDGLLREVAAALRLTANVISTPTFLDCTIDDPHIAEQRRIVEGLDDVSNDLQKLSQTLKLTDRLVAGTVAVDEANRRLDEIEALRPPYPAPVVGVAYAACGAGFAVILSAGWRDVGLAAGLSLIVFILVQASGRSAWLGNRIYVISTFVSSAMAGVLGVVLGESDTNVVALCAFVVLIPGLGSTLGAFELAAGHTLLAWNRFIQAVVQTFALFAGASIGAMVVRAIIGVPVVPDQGSPGAPVKWIFLVVFTVGLVVVFQVIPGQASWSVVAGLLAYGALELGGRAGDWQGPFLGAPWRPRTNWACRNRGPDRHRCPDPLCRA